MKRWPWLSRGSDSGRGTTSFGGEPSSRSSLRRLLRSQDSSLRQTLDRQEQTYRVMAPATDGEKVTLRLDAQGEMLVEPDVWYIVSQTLYVDADGVIWSRSLDVRNAETGELVAGRWPAGTRPRSEEK